MTGPGDRAADAALWRRWRLQSQSAPGLEAPDPVLLAAYAEGRLDDAEAEPVEAWLAENPAALEDLLAAAAAGIEALPAAPERVMLRAEALVPAGSTDPGKVVPFPLVAAHRRQAWRTVVSWGALAASLLVTSFVGFGIGNDAYESLARPPTIVESIGHELLDPPSTLFDDAGSDT